MDLLDSNSPFGSDRPLRAWLEQEVRQAVRKHRVVVWLDLEGHYSGFVDELHERFRAGELPYAVHGFRGSHLALLLALEEVSGGLVPGPLLLHLPGYNQETLRLSPMLELARAGSQFQPRLDSALTSAASGRVPPEAIAHFLTQAPLTLAAADAWLARRLADRTVDGLALQLEATPLPALLDDLLSGGLLAGRLRDPDVLACCWEVLESRTGVSAAWREQALPEPSARPTEVAFAVASWCLAVEYVHDPPREPHDPLLRGLERLPRGVVEACREVADHLRRRQGTFYQRTADETEGWLADEVREAKAEDLGKVDTFRFEEGKVLLAALQAVADERWALASPWAERRIRQGTFWLNGEPNRRSTWELIDGAVRLGEALTQAGPSLQAASLPDALERYTALGAPVDLAHRHLEQRRSALLHPQLPEFEALRARLDGLRELWRVWADNWARDFNQLCREQGFLPPAALQQRHLFDDVVRPLAQESGTTALFLVDALRYEMAQELMTALEGTPATTVHLKARLAELPTVTEVGMNALAPVARSGRLAPQLVDGRFNGFQAGEYRVNHPETRRRAMAERVGGATTPLHRLEEVLALEASALKRSISRASLVVVHSQDIDDAGEKGLGPAVFDTLLQRLRAAWRLLREAGVRRFVITADHGFLLLDPSAHQAIPHGRKIDPSRRYVLSSVAADHRNEVRVPLSSLLYDPHGDLHLMLPASTAVFETNKRGHSFVHGGNSLQERVIPVLTVVHRAAAGADHLRYQVQASASEPLAGMHCLKVQVAVAAQGQLAFSGQREVELSLQVVDDEVTTVDLCQARGGGRVEGGSLFAPIGDPFELFFKLSGPSETRVRVALRGVAGQAEVTPCTVEARFTVTATQRAERAPPPAADRSWLDELPPAVRPFFAHLATHGVVTASEVLHLVPGRGDARDLTKNFEVYLARAPFSAHVEVVENIKRYVRNGGPQ